MKSAQFPAPYIFLFPLISGILLWKSFPFSEEYLLILFLFSSAFFLSLAILFKKISVYLLCLFMVFTGIFCAGFNDSQKSKILPLPEEKIAAFFGTVKDVREKGTLLVLLIENRKVSDGKNWFDGNFLIRTSVPVNTGVYTSDWIILYEIKKIEKKDQFFLVSGKKLEIVEDSSSFNTFKSSFNRWKENLIKKHFKYHSQQAAIFRMMVLGDKRQSDDIKQVFIKTGTYHLLVVSGIHIGYLILFLRLVCFPFRRFEQVNFKLFNLLYLAVILFYTFITGCSTPVVRAALMFGIYLFAETIGRPVSGLHAIAWAGFFILFFNPDELFNMGFQLSFGATSGIVLAFRNIHDIRKIPSWLNSTVKALLGAQIFIIPILAAHTDQFYPAALITNLIIVPTGAIAVFLGLTFLITGYFTGVFAFPLIKTLDLFWFLNKSFSNICPEIHWTPGFFSITGFYMAIFAFLFRKRWKIFSSLALFFFLIQPFFKDTSNQNQTTQPAAEKEEAITIYQAHKLLCSIEKDDTIILIVSERENEKTLQTAIENIKNSGKKIVIFFT